MCIQESPRASWPGLPTPRGTHHSALMQLSGASGCRFWRPGSSGPNRVLCSGGLDADDAGVSVSGGGGACIVSHRLTDDCHFILQVFFMLGSAVGHF